MADFKCEVVRVHLEAHPNADAIEIARIGDYQSIVKKGLHEEGGLAVYLPEGALVPVWLLREMGMYDEEKQKGGLAGSAGNRVKAIKLRGIVSQGIMVPCVRDECSGAWGLQREENGIAVFEGDDVAEFLGVTKWEPALPSYMAARVLGVDFDATHKYDFDNLKKTPTLFEDGEQVVITEKIHGTLMCIGVVPERLANDKYYGRRVIVTSKGQGAKGFVLAHDDETNIYAQAAIKHNLFEKVLNALGPTAEELDKPVFLFGEVFGRTPGGKGVQDLTYTDEPLDYRAFDICVGNRNAANYLDFIVFDAVCQANGIPVVPVLYVGPYSKEVVLEHTDGATTLSPAGLSSKKQIREGVVVKAKFENRHTHYGRKIAKSVSDAYLLRKGDATEFN